MNTNDVAKLAVFGPVLATISRPANAILQWKNNFVLQSATNLSGPYQDVNGAPNPYTNSYTGGLMQFFRLRQ
jgi:hypothetical protein